MTPLRSLSAALRFYTRCPWADEFGPIGGLFPFAFLFVNTGTLDLHNNLIYQANGLPYIASGSNTPGPGQRHGIEVLHPRYPLLPKIGMSTAPFLLAGACARSLRKVLERGYQFDVIDAHYFYPAGVAAMLLGRHFGKPVVITARGSDINLIAQHAIPRRLIMWAARRAAAVVAVSQALRCPLEQLGVDGAKVCVLRNGVDLDAFRPLDRDAERARLGVGADWCSRWAICSSSRGMSSL